jgi:STE24 endopeptidase
MTYLYAYYLQVLFIVLIVVNHLWEIYLNRRQLSTLQRSLNEVPSEFSDQISIDDHQKAIRYSSARLNVGLFHLLVDAAILFYWFPFRGAESLFQSLPAWGMHRDVLFLLSFGMISFLLSLPWSLYSTFVLEEKFGFNRTDLKTFFLDRTKGLILSLLIGLPLLYSVIFLFNTLGSWWWITSFALFTLVQFIMVWIYPTWIAPLFNKFESLQSEGLRRDIDSLVERAGFKSQGVFVMDASKRSSHGNAYFTGFGKNKRIVFFDTLLKELSGKEIMAILAHELGHLKLKHVLKSLITSVALSFLGFYLMHVLSESPWFYAGHFIKAVSPGILLFLFLQALPIYTFWFTPLTNFISRKREFEADEYAAKETQARDLVSGLLNLYQKNSSPVVADRLYSAFYFSHPPALDRVRKLKSLEA